MTIEEFNRQDEDRIRDQLLKCCGSDHWVNGMMRYHPFASEQDLEEKAAFVWYHECMDEDWMEAFAQHPKIGDLKSLQEKFAGTKEWAGAEQAGVNIAAGNVVEELAKGNEAYENKFGFIFIVCATGKSAEEMLALLRQRLSNEYKKEIMIAMEEQNKITQLRIKKLLL
jgi:2-oxo-4-hydroxy-4-carboxy-5-ureidoimidazoline decarboxylase